MSKPPRKVISKSFLQKRAFSFSMKSGYSYKRTYNQSVHFKTRSIIQMDDQLFSKSGMVSRDYLCNAVPGHSECKKRIGNDKCPSSHGAMTDTMCHGHSHNKAADVPAAKQAMGAVSANKEKTDIATSVPDANQVPS
jgi:hypothetical protein